MKELPLLLSQPMVPPFIARLKTATRRTPNCMNSLVDGKRVSGKTWKDLDFDLAEYYIRDNMFFLMSKKDMKYYKVEPIYQPGDWIYFREKWSMIEREGQGTDKQFLVYETEWNGNEVIESAPLRSVDKFYKWGGHPSIHLPKELTRLWAEVSTCKCEHIQDITEEQAKAEGVDPVQAFNSGEGTPTCQLYKNYLPDGYMEVTAIDSFQSLWQSIHGPESWISNPPVYAINYKILSTTGKPLEKEKQQ